MATRQNPFYQSRNSGMGSALNGLAAVLFPEADPRVASANAENMAQADAATANAGKYREQTRGYRDVNDAMVSNPAALAEFFMSGGVLKDDPMRRNPNYKDMPPTDFSTILTQAPMPISEDMLLPGATANEKMAAAIQEANIRGMNLDQVFKGAGTSEYLRRAGGENPDSALAFGPFAGLNPNQNTALTSGRQDSISARDSKEAKALENIRQSGANSRNQYSVDNKPVSANNNQDVIITPTQGIKLGITPNADGQYVIRGRTTVNTGQDQKPGSLGGEDVAGREKPVSTKSGADKVTAVPAAAGKRMESIILKTLMDKGVTPTPEILAGLTSEAGTVWQSNKNPDAAADSILQRLRNGEVVNGVSYNVQERTLRSDKTTLKREQPKPGAKPPDIATVDGAPKGAAVGVYVNGKGYEVKDKSGKVIGYAQ